MALWYLLKFPTSTAVIKACHGSSNKYVCLLECHNVYSGTCVPAFLLSRSPIWYVCTDFSVVSITDLIRMYRLSCCLRHQTGMYVPTFLLSRSPIWYVCSDFPVVSITNLVRMYRISYCLRHQSGTYVPTSITSDDAWNQRVPLEIWCKTEQRVT
jgi:hypothetical protein